MENNELRVWKTLSRRVILEHGRFLTVESHRIKLPNGEVIADWPWVIIPNAAIVIAVTDDEKFVCFRQVKYAVDGVSLAPVGGMIEEGESPLEAAKRELLEETGYEAREWVSFGKYAVDPNRGVAEMHLFMAMGAKKVSEPNSDDLEDQELVSLSRAEMERAVENGEVKVLAWVAVIALALNYLERKSRMSG